MIITRAAINLAHTMCIHGRGTCIKCCEKPPDHPDRITPWWDPNPKKWLEMHQWERIEEDAWAAIEAVKSIEAMKSVDDLEPPEDDWEAGRQKRQQEDERLAPLRRERFLQQMRLSHPEGLGHTLPIAIPPHLLAEMCVRAEIAALAKSLGGAAGKEIAPPHNTRSHVCTAVTAQHSLMNE